MRNRISRAILASNSGLPADAAETCQRILAMREDMHPWLSANPEITTTTWHALWGTARPEAAIAQGLVARELDAAQRRVVITKENRVGVLKIFVAHNELTLDEQILLSGKANAAAAMLEQPWLDKSLRKPLALKLGDLALLREMALAPHGTFTDDELLQLVLTYPSWPTVSSDPRKGAKDRNRYLRILFGRRPGLIAPVVEHLLTAAASTGTSTRREQDVLTAIAGSAHLDGDTASRIAGIESGRCTLARKTFDERYYCLLALVNNPRCPRQVVTVVSEASRTSTSGDSGLFRSADERRETRPDIVEPFAGLDDPETLEWVIRRSLPYRSENSDRPARPVELVELGKNPNLTERQRATVRDAILRNVENELVESDDELVKALWPEGLPSCPAPRAAARRQTAPNHVQEAFDLAATKLGNDPVRWETLIGLLDDYDGTFEDLVSLSESI